MTFPRICVDCDRSITGDFIVASEGFSASGAREDMYAHPPDDPASTGRTAARGLLRRALEAEPVARPSRLRR